MPRKREGGEGRGGGKKRGVDEDVATNATLKRLDSHSRARGISVRAGFEAGRRWGRVSSVKQTSKGGERQDSHLSVVLMPHSTCRSDEVHLQWFHPL